MKIAIQAADLDSKRIDGTRVYLLNMLRRFGEISPSDDFFIYHKGNFNSELIPPEFKNYQIKKIAFPFFWTQTRFAWEMLMGNCDCLWMPMQAIPWIKKNKLRTTVTIHDLAFKYFPQYFPKKDLCRLNFFTDFAIRKSDKIIAVSRSTKKDILKFYPEIKEEKIKVIYHGFDPALFQREESREEADETLKTYGLQTKNYLLYVGAIQPRKNLEKLVEAFEIVKRKNNQLKLAIAGGQAWMAESIMNKIESSHYKSDIIVTGTISFAQVAILYKNSSVFVFPSLYEGFGIPILEAQASGVPVVASNNSSIVEITTIYQNNTAVQSAKLINPENPQEISDAIESLVENELSRVDLIKKGNENIKRFSWDRCAKETIEWMKGRDVIPDE
jgi:glycosyltransferase involved in cell wall biosynthesis